MIYVVELESLKERYTYWWSEYIPRKIKEARKQCRVISGEVLSDKVETGAFLDAGSTNHWKAVQLQKISKMFFDESIKENDTFLVCDIWFPGIEMIRYMSQAYQIPVNIWGIWHAGSCTHNDFAEPMHSWSKHFEIGFLNMCNGIFVGSDYSKQSIIDRLLYDLHPNEIDSISKRIHPYGLPLDYQYLQQFESKKENLIVFPHRPDIEKNPHIFISIIHGLKMTWDDFEDYKFIFCTSKEQYKSNSSWINMLMATLSPYENVVVMQNLSKEQYYKLLGKACLTISTTSEENFGYCNVEAMALGCPVLVPNAFSHPEILEDNYDMMYSDYDEMMKKITLLPKMEINTAKLKEYVKPYDSVVGKWIQIMSS